MAHKAVFLDRDGTLNELVPYLDNPAEFSLLEGASHAVKLLNDGGFKVIIVSNQSGLNRGYFSVRGLERIHNEMQFQLSKNGAQIDGLYFCPHKPEEGCICRKPKTGLLEIAAKEHSIDGHSSFFIGDRLSDIQAGVSFGCKSILVLTGYGESELHLVKQIFFEKVIIALNLVDAVEKILNRG